MHELSITRDTPVPREKLYAGWTTPALYPQWFCPKPWYVSDVKMDLRPGGSGEKTFHGPNGEIFTNRGVYLEIVPNEKLVFTDVFTADWQPNPDFMFVTIMTLEPLPNSGTRYTARARHWTKAARE